MVCGLCPTNPQAIQKDPYGPGNLRQRAAFQKPRHLSRTRIRVRDKSIYIIPTAAVCTRYVCVLHTNPFFLPVDNQHNQCPCRLFNPRRDTSSLVTKLRHRDTTLPRMHYDRKHSSEWGMQCHVITLDTTSTTYTFYETEKRKETKKNKKQRRQIERKEGKKKRRRNKLSYPPPAGDVADAWKERGKEYMRVVVEDNLTLLLLIAQCHTSVPVLSIYF